MVFLIVAAAAVPLLYFWLIGHWFGRVLAFLTFGAVLGFIGAMMFGADARPPAVNIAWLGVLLGFALAWPVSGIPIYVRRHQARDASMELALR